MIQDFVPLAESLEWELGLKYLRERGNKAFTADALPVPCVINKGGSQSRHTAEVFFATFQLADKTGLLEPQNQRFNRSSAMRSEFHIEF